MRQRSGARLVEISNRQQHPLQHRAIDAPQEIGLVLIGVDAAMQLAIYYPRVMTGCNPLRVNAVRLLQKVAELCESVAANAGNWRPATGVFFDEVVDYVVAESTFQV